MRDWQSSTSGAAAFNLAVEALGHTGVKTTTAEFGCRPFAGLDAMNFVVNAFCLGNSSLIAVGFLAVAGLAEASTVVEIVISTKAASDHMIIFDGGG